MIDQIIAACPNASHGYMVKDWVDFVIYATDSASHCEEFAASDFLPEGEMTQEEVLDNFMKFLKETYWGDFYANICENIGVYGILGRR